MTTKRKLIKIKEAIELTGLSRQVIIARIEKGILSRPQNLDIPTSKKRTLRVYKDEVMNLIDPIPTLELKIKAEKPLSNL